jgi:hypothetical protein
MGNSASAFMFSPGYQYQVFDNVKKGDNPTGDGIQGDNPARNGIQGDNLTGDGIKGDNLTGDGIKGDTPTLEDGISQFASAVQGFSSQYGSHRVASTAYKVTRTFGSIRGRFN